jgi:hypothetical protein
MIWNLPDDATPLPDRDRLNCARGSAGRLRRSALLIPAHQISARYSTVWPHTARSIANRQLRNTEDMNNEDMTTEVGKIELSAQDLRVVARYAAERAKEVLSIFEATDPGDRRPRAAVEAAWIFVEGAERTKLQRTSAFAAHAAARETTTEAARDAARAAGHAAAAAYLHPLAKSTQVRHILGAAAHAARATELAAGGDRSVGAAHIEHARQRATPALVAVLRRYPVAPSSGNRVTELMSALDTALRSL